MESFTKHNHTPYPDSLQREAEGLALLAETLRADGNRLLNIPRVLSVDQHTLRMTAIAARSPDEAQMAVLGEGLARLHGVRQPYYGLRIDNYIGLAPQPNRVADAWGAFFVDTRLGYQIGRIRDDRVRAGFADTLRHQRERLIEFLEHHCEHPSLLHGDLWSGNVLFDERGPWLIDPAVYYGDREADLAMTEMFGGFTTAFYHAYDRVYPRTTVYPRKRSIYNFYHYLNHYNLFGGAYLEGCREGLRAIEAL